MARVLVIGDTHCPGMRRGYVDFLKRVADQYDINRTVHIGDLVDWAAISYHAKSPGIHNATAEKKAADRQVQQLHRAFDDAEWLVGNHDCLPIRKAEDAGIPRELIKDYNEIWQVGWKVHDRYSSVVIDGVSYSHGETGRGGQNAAFKQAQDNFRPTVIGHFHGQAGVKYGANSEFRYFGMSVGCGMDAKRLQFEYGRKFTTKPVLGCGVVINGKRAIFEPWLLNSR